MKDRHIELESKTSDNAIITLPYSVVVDLCPRVKKNIALRPQQSIVQHHPTSKNWCCSKGWIDT